MPSGRCLLWYRLALLLRGGAGDSADKKKMVAGLTTSSVPLEPNQPRFLLS